MEKITLFLLCLFSSAAFAQENTVSPKYAKLLENCCIIKKGEKERYAIGEMKSSSEEFRKNLLKKRRIQIDIVPDDVGIRRGGLAIVQKPGRFYGIEYRQNF